MLVWLVASAWLVAACGEDGSSATTPAAADAADTISDVPPADDQEDRAPDGGEVVLSPEGDFELLEEWELTGPGDYEGRLDFDVTRSGLGASRYLTPIVPQPEDLGRWTITLSADDYVGRRIQFRTFLRFEPDGLGLVLAQVDSAAGEIIWATRSDELIEGTPDWTKASLTLDVEDEASTITFTVGMIGQDTWFDDSVVVEATDETLSANRIPRAPVNLDFESSLANGTLEGWFGIGNTDPNTHTSGLSTTHVYEGASSGEVRSTTGENGYVGLIQSIRAIDYQGQTVRWRAYVATDSVEGSAGLLMEVDGVDYALLELDDMSDRPIRGTTDWTEYQMVLPVAEDAWRIAFGALLLDGGGVLFIDDGHLEIVGE